MRELSATLTSRRENDLSPIETDDAPRELLPLLDATNEVMARLDHLLDHQKRFVRDTSHQLRTPLAVLKTQVQSALRGDMPAAQALHEINHTVDRATELANQMLALAKVEQLRQQGGAPVIDWAEVAACRRARPVGPDRRLHLDFLLDVSSAPRACPRVGTARTDAQPAAQRGKEQPRVFAIEHHASSRCGVCIAEDFRQRPGHLGRAA